jgi:hypothetical protein
MRRFISFAVLCLATMMSAAGTYAADRDALEPLMAQPPKVRLRARIVVKGQTEYASLDLREHGRVVLRKDDPSIPVTIDGIEHRFELRKTANNAVQAKRQRRQLIVDYYQRAQSSPRWNGPRPVIVLP